MVLIHKDSMGLTILKAMTEMGGSGITPNIRAHMKIKVSNNFAGNLTDLYQKHYLTKKKDPNTRGGTGNIYSISAKGKAFLKANPSLVVSYANVANDLQQRYEATQQRKVNKGYATPPKVSKVSNTAIDSIAGLIDENQKLEGMLRGLSFELKAMSARISVALDDPPEDVE